MHCRSLRPLAALATASALLLASAHEAGAAGAKDKEATKLYDQAMNEDYLNADFPKAEKRLKDALAKCGDSGCSPEVVGKINILLGTVYGIGMNKPAEAKDAFIKALKADPNAALDASLSTPELTKIFADAKKAAGSGGGAAKPSETPKQTASSGGFTPPAEGPVNTPLPLYFEPPADQAVAKAGLRYKPFGGTKYKSVEMKKMGKGFGAEIPCDDVTTTGDIKFYFVLTDENGDPAGTVGSANEPFKTSIKNEIEGDAPHLPGKKPPDQCKEKGACPPDFPGCKEEKKKGGEKGWGASCEASSECKEGLVCLNGTCEEGKEEGGKKDEGKGKRNLVSVGVQLDMLVIGGASNVCSGGESNANYACFLQGTDKQFFGTPVERTGTNGIKGGFGYGDVRILASYDRQILKNLGLTIGARFGVVIGGTPSPSNADEAGNSPIAPYKKFPPIHAELRVGWAFGGNIYEEKKFRPYVFVAGGLAQVNASVPVQVCDSKFDPNETAKPCPNAASSVQRTVDAYQITGLNFVGFGGGTTYGIYKNFGVFAELKMMFMLPTFGFVFAPTLGPVIGF